MDGYGYDMYADSPNAGIVDDRPSSKPEQKSVTTNTKLFLNRFCSTCGKKLVLDYKYCPLCGKKVGERKKENQCLCGAIFEPGEKFCFSCGKRVPQKPK